MIKNKQTMTLIIPPSEWKSVKEVCPIENGFYWITFIAPFTNSRAVTRALYEDGWYDMFGDFFEYGEITHWAKLNYPEPCQK